MENDKKDLIAENPQRLRFFLRYRQLILFTQTSSGFVLKNKVVLHDDENNLQKALVWFNSTAREIKIEASTGGIPDNYLGPFELFFDDTENSFWNDTIGDAQGIVIGIGDLRDLNINDDMDDFLLTMILPTAKDSAIIFEFVGEFQLNLYAKSMPSIKQK